MAGASVPVFKPLLEAEEKQAAVAALDLGWLGPGSYVKEFEQACHKLIGASDDQTCVAVSTGTSAVHLALLSMGLSAGDEIITPSFNNIGVFQAIKAIGANIVFCDVDRETLTIDPAKLEELITPKTKIINVLDYGCQQFDYDAVAAICQKHNLRLFYDAAHSFGSNDRDGRPIGSRGDTCIFSFDPVKNITLIDGGLVVVNNAEQARFVQHARQIGQEQDTKVLYENQRSWFYDVSHIGFRYHLANLHAAIGLEQIKKIDKIRRTRIATCKRFNQAFETIDALTLPATVYDHLLPFMYVVRVPTDQRDAFREYLKDNGVDTGIHWQAGHHFTYLKDEKRGDLSVTEDVVKQIVTLPLHSCMDKQDEDKVIDVVTQFFKDKM